MFNYAGTTQVKWDWSGETGDIWSLTYGIPSNWFWGNFLIISCTRDILISYILQKWMCPKGNLRHWTWGQWSFRSFSRSAEKEGWHSWQLRPGCCCSVRCWSGISSEYRHCGEARPRSMSPFLTPLGGVITYPWSCSSTVWLLLSRLKTHYCNLPDYGSPSSDWSPIAHRWV